MKLFSIAVFVLLTLPLQANVIRMTAGVPVKVPMQDATAVYSLDADCADVRLESGYLVITGRRACSTQVISVLPYSVIELDVEVKAKPRQLELLREAQRRSQQLQEFGSVSTSYASDRSEYQTTVDAIRSEGPSSTNASFTFLNGYGYNGPERRSAIPRASIEIHTPDLRLGFLDRRVDDSPLTLDNVTIRGIHADTGSFYGHLGIASLSDFRAELMESDPDKTAAVGYRARPSAHSVLTTTIEGIRASNRYLSGRSGILGSLKYEYAIPQHLHFSGQIGASRGIGSSGSFDYTGSSTTLSMNARYMPAQFAVLSNTPGPGFIGSGSLSHRLSSRFGLEASGSRESYSGLERPTQTAQMGMARLLWHAARSITASAGLAVSEFRGTAQPGYRTVSVPTSLVIEWRRLTNSFQYDFKDSELYGGSHSFRDTLRLNLHSVTLTAMAEQQAQAPTLSYVLNEVPALRQALLAANTVVTSPEQLADFLRENADLLASGALRDLTLNISPLRREFGATAQWTATHRISARLEWRTDRDQGVADTKTFTTSDTRLTARLTSDIEFSSGIMHTNSTFTGHVPLRDNVFTVSLRRQFHTIPRNMLPTFGGATIRGTVYVFAEGGATPERKMTGVTVMLDGTRRTRTDGSGHYSFGSVPQGKHTVDVILEKPDLYVSTTPPHVVVDQDATADFGFGILKATVFGSVRNDAGNPIRGVTLLISGSARRETKSQDSGKFLLNDLQAGSYTISIDSDSLPAGYALDSLAPVTVSIEPGHPGLADLRVRALRRVSGRITCSSSHQLGEVAAIVSVPNESPRTVAIDQSGSFFVRNLPAGKIQFDFSREDQRYSTSIDLGPDPVTLNLGNIDLCEASGRGTASKE